MRYTFSKKKYWSIFILLFFVLLFLRFYSQPIVEYLYEKQNFNVLDKICSNQGSMPLDYYQGRIENVLLGPAKSLIAGILLLSFCLFYRTSLTPLRFGIVLFLYLLTTRAEFLLEPPYGEAFTGPFVDATWLYRNNLNYFELYRQGSHMEGGPHVYPTSLFPLFLATLMKLIPNQQIFFIVMHSLVFLFTTVIIVLFRKVLASVFDDKTAVFGSILILSLPLFQSMLEILNMEMACLFFVFLTAYLLWKDKFVLASITALAANFVKDPGVIACLSVFIISLIYFAQTKEPKLKWKALICGMIVLVVSFIKFKIRLMVIGQQSHFNQVAALSGLRLIWGNPWTKMFLIAVIIFLFGIVAEFIRSKGKKGAFFQLLQEQKATIIMFVFAAMWFLIYLNFSAMHHRYSLLSIPFLVFVFVYAVKTIQNYSKAFKWIVLILSGFLYFSYFTPMQWFLFVLILLAVLFLGKRIMNAGFVLLIIFSFFSAYGFIYPDECRYQLTYENNCQLGNEFGEGCYKQIKYSPVISHCNPSVLERSLEYRNYLKIQKKIVREMVDNYSEYLIVAPAIGAAETMFFPEMGYVKKPLNVQGYGGTINLGLPDYVGLEHVDIAKTVYFGFRYDRIIPEVEYPIDSRDKILRYVTYGDIQGVIFLGGFGIEKMRRIILLTNYRSSRYDVKQRQEQ